MTHTIKYTNDTSYHLTKAHPTDAGLDLPSAENIKLCPGERHAVSTGIRLQLPHGTSAEVLPRSGLALKEGITVLNAPGLIDQNYRGEIKVILINHGKTAKHITKGDRIAQLVIRQTVPVELIETTHLDETAQTGSDQVAGNNREHALTVQYIIDSMDTRPGKATPLSIIKKQIPLDLKDFIATAIEELKEEGVLHEHKKETYIIQ